MLNKKLIDLFIMFNVHIKTGKSVDFFKSIRLKSTLYRSYINIAHTTNTLARTDTKRSNFSKHRQHPIKLSR